MRWRDFDSLAPLPDDLFSSGPRRVHFIGIGGIGMSGLARLLLSQGHAISGSDEHDSPLLQSLREAGVAVSLGHSPKNITSNTPDAVIWGSAISEDNPERAASLSAGIPQFHRAQLLADFVNGARFSIAVSGTHGKSTTSAMVAHILEKLGHNPTAILGAVYEPFGSNVRVGDPDLIVVEADESDGSFTLCRPTVAVVTNVEAEHLENYDDSEESLWRAFEKFTGSATEAVLNADDPLLIVRLDDDEWALRVAIQAEAHLSADAIEARDGLQSFDLVANDVTLGSFAMGVPGRHNVSNALAALGACWLHQVDISVNTETQVFDEGDMARMAAALRDFRGVGRRFEYVGEANNIVIYDDYAHHPTEVAATLQAAREFLNRPITAIFQPHRFSRTAQMGEAFGPSFGAARRVIITELYSAFEEPIEGISGRIIFEAVQKAFPDKIVEWADSLEDARRLALELTKPGEAIITMGAGDIGKEPAALLAQLQSAVTA
jgi:UDP-N-acetylmuramate--alanine ligase